MAQKAEPHTKNSFLSRREAEINAGRKKIEERSAGMRRAGNTDARHLSKLTTEADRARKEDEERRAALLDTAATFNKVEADRAGAEVIDQAQTELEAVQHLADRNEPILDYRRERIIEKLEGDADPAQATAITTDIVTAQAVNQPTVLAHNAGTETENRPLNASTMRDDEVVLVQAATPADKHVPKTRKQAEKIARQKVPPAEKLVKEEAVVTQQEPEENEAVEIVRKAPDTALGE